MLEGTRHILISRKRAVYLGLLGIIFVLAILLPHTASAQVLDSSPLNDFRAVVLLRETPVPLIVARLIRAFLSIIGIIAVIIILWGGFLWMTSGGDPEKVNKAKDVLKNGAIGLIIVFASFSIATFIINALLRTLSPGGGITNISDRYNEPLSGSLGAGIVQDHYPMRNQHGIARNTMIFVTFKEPIDLASIIDTGTFTGKLVDGSVEIKRDDTGVALLGTDVNVSATADQKTFIFDPVNLLGDPNPPEVGYTVHLSSNIMKDNGFPAFSGVFSGGYSWPFWTDTNVDTTPPRILSVFPEGDSVSPAITTPYPKNMSVQITFNEAMNPISTTGIFDGAGPVNPDFDLINTQGGAGTVTGEYIISNGYKTVTFQPDFACAQDQCNNTVYCLPGPDNINVQIKSASLLNAPPDATADPATGAPFGYDGVTDAAGNSFDGNSSGQADGPSTDDYNWSFATSNAIDGRSPIVSSHTPDINDQGVSTTDPVTISFTQTPPLPLLSTSITTESVQMWPDDQTPGGQSNLSYEIWFYPSLDPSDTTNQTVMIEHPTLVSRADEGYVYFPLVNEKLRGVNQFCYFPSKGPSPCVSPGIDPPTGPYCCNGSPSNSPCTTSGGAPLPR